MWSIDLTKSFWSRVVSVWFLDFYIRPMVHPLYSEYLKVEGGVFFGELYERLSGIDQKLADTLLLSTSC